MKRTTLITLLLMLFTATLSAQSIANHALGLRLEDSDQVGTEISYQKSLAAANRAEFTLGWRDSDDFDAFKFTGLYQWVQVLDGNFNWYYGLGGGLGTIDVKGSSGVDEDDEGFFAFVAGAIGIEYDFEMPLLLSLDFRPEIGIAGDDAFDDDFDFDIALGIRYQF